MTPCRPASLCADSAASTAIAHDAMACVPAHARAPSCVQLGPRLFPRRASRLGTASAAAFPPGVDASRTLQPCRTSQYQCDPSCRISCFSGLFANATGRGRASPEVPAVPAAREDVVEGAGRGWDEVGLRVVSDRNGLDPVPPERAAHDERRLAADCIACEDDPAFRDRNVAEPVAALGRAPTHLRDDPPPCSGVRDHALGRTRLLAPGHHVAARRDRCHEGVREDTGVCPSVRHAHHGCRVPRGPRVEDEARRGRQTEERVDVARKRLRGAGGEVAVVQGRLELVGLDRSALPDEVARVGRHRPGRRVRLDHERACGQARGMRRGHSSRHCRARAVAAATARDADQGDEGERCESAECCGQPHSRASATHRCDLSQGS